MAESGFGARYYHKQAMQMRHLADRAPTEAMRTIYERLAANLLKLAEEKSDNRSEEKDDGRAS